jgi:hypothetical protein
LAGQALPLFRAQQSCAPSRASLHLAIIASYRQSGLFDHGFGMLFFARLSALALFLASFPALAEDPPRQPQYVIISFDSASFITQWERSRALGERTGAHFTYFLSCVYLLSPET